MARMSVRGIYICAASIVLLGSAIAHGGAHQKPLVVDPNADWATRHMAEEHHIGNFDPASFFSLHDFDGDDAWNGDEIAKFYGLDDETARDITLEKRHALVDRIMELIDRNDNGHVERNEFLDFIAGGHTLPDFGYGPGHHWDMETEYEIHHWERYHDENTREEDLTHPEDIEHFKRHDQLEEEAEAQAKLDAQPVVEHNIPPKFIRHGS